MSRFVDLLKQIPPGKEEIPDDLLKKLDIAAINLITNKAGQHDLPEAERLNFAFEDLPEMYDWGGAWSRPDFYYRFPLEPGDIWLLKYKGDIWKLGVSFGGNPIVTFCEGSKKQMIEERHRLNDIKDKNGKEALEDEIMELMDDYTREDGRSY